jgi:CubicO group peptidase (beta-lactamase class C family)
MTIEIHGSCDERFRPFEDAFRANFGAGHELGASLALTWRGRTVVDLWAGWADRDRTRPWEEDTLVATASTTKFMTTIAALMVVDRGLLELDAPVARYWPEFAQGGKGAVTVRDVFNHRTGVPAVEPSMSIVNEDWAEIIARIARQPHWFEGEHKVVYHAMTYGFILGELMRRTDGRGPAPFFREEIAAKAGVDFHLGLSSQADVARLAENTPPPAAAPPPAGSLLERFLRAHMPAQTLTPAQQQARFFVEAPSGNGYGNGRSIARAGAILAMRGELEGVRYLSSEIVAEAGRGQVYEECPYLGWVSFGLGFGCDSEKFPLATPTMFGWGGVGGSWAMVDPKAGVSLGYAPNNWSVEWEGIVDPRHIGFKEAMEALLPGLSAGERSPSQAAALS